MRRSLAKKGIDGAGKSTLLALIDTPTDLSSLRLKSRRPVKFVRTPRSQLSDMDYTELSVLEVEILRKIDTINTTIHSLSVDPHTMKRAYDNHLAEMRKNNGGSGRATTLQQQDHNKARSQYSYLLLNPMDGMYGEEALVRLRELFVEYCAPGLDVLSYIQTRELLRNAHVLPSIDGVEDYLSTSTVGALSYALSDAFQDQKTFESFLVEVLVESYENSHNGSTVPPTTMNEGEDKDEINSNLICANIPGLGLGLRYLGFIELTRRLEMEQRTSLVDMLSHLHKPLSTISDRWRRRIEHIIHFTVKCAVEARGPTQDQIEFAEQQKQLAKLASKKGRPQAKKRKKKRKKGTSFAQEKAQLIAEKEAIEKKAKLERKNQIMKRRIELQRAMIRDQKEQFLKRYHYDIDAIIDAKNICIIVYLLFNVVLTEEDGSLLLKPLVEHEIMDDQITYENAINAQRTKRLRVIVEKQGLPPRTWPMKSTVVNDMMVNKDKWFNVRNSDLSEFEGFADSRPSSRGSSRRSRPTSRSSSRPGSRSGGTRSKSGSRPGSRSRSRPGSRSGTRGSSRPGSRGTGGENGGGSVSWEHELLVNGPSPQVWSRRMSLMIQSSTRRIRNIGRKVRGYLMKDNMKLPVTEKNEENELSSQQQFGKSKEAKKARKKFKAMQAEKARQKAKENDCFSKISLNVGGLEKVPLDMSDKENVIFFETEWVKDTSIDVGDILDEVDCPEECASFLSVSFEVDAQYNSGSEEDDAEIDRAVQILRRVCKALFDEQVFQQLSCYHSHSVLYDPDQTPPQVRVSIYLQGTAKEIRHAYGVPVVLSTLFTSFGVQGSLRPSSKMLFHPMNGENIVLDNEFQMRSNVNIGYKKKVVQKTMEHTIRAMEDFYPYVDQYHTERIHLNLESKNKNIVEMMVGGRNKEEAEQREETKDGTSKTVAAMAKEKIQNDSGGKNVKHETEEKEGGSGIWKRVRDFFQKIEQNIVYSTKHEIEIAIPSLSMLLMPESPDCFQSFVSPAMRVMLARLVNQPGGMIDTVKLMWDSYFGYEWSWDNFQHEYFKIMDLMKHSEENKKEEMIYKCHHTLRNVLTSVREIRIQIHDRGLKTEFKNFYIHGFMPAAPSKSQIAERERKKKQHL